MIVKGLAAINNKQTAFAKLKTVGDHIKVLKENSYQKNIMTLLLRDAYIKKGEKRTEQAGQMSQKGLRFFNFSIFPATVFFGCLPCLWRRA